MTHGKAVRFEGAVQRLLEASLTPADVLEQALILIVSRDEERPNRPPSNT